MKLLQRLHEVNYSHWHAIIIRRPIPAKASILDTHPWWQGEKAQDFYEELLTALDEAGIDTVKLLEGRD